MIDQIIRWLLWFRVKDAVAPYHRDWAWRMLLAEVKDTHVVVARAIEYHKTEVDILADRLTKRFDPGMALTEASERARQRKAQIVNDPDPIRELTPLQKLALKDQEETAKANLRRSA